MSALDRVDLLVIGAGPGGLAAAIRYKQKCPAASVVVIEKAPQLGAHSLSGAVMETACLDALLPGWRSGAPDFLSDAARVREDEMYFLTRRMALRIPPLLVPPGMHHQGDHVVSLGMLVRWLGRRAEDLGVEIYTGFSAASLVWDHDRVAGVRLVDQGLDAARQPKSNFLAGEDILASVVVLADGALGVLSREFIAKVKGQQNPQVFSLGVKQLVRLPVEEQLRPGRVIHTLGFPNKQDVFGGGFLYSLDAHVAAVGLIVGLDWRYTDVDLQKELEIFKAHPFIAGLLKGGRVIEAGAKTIPEGGFFALPRLSQKGVFLVGDAAGLVNMEKIKGVHYAVFSGMAAADAAVDGRPYMEHLAAAGVISGMRHAKNFRAVFQAGLYLGAPLSMIQCFWPWRLGMVEDHCRTTISCRLRRQDQVDMDRAEFAALARTSHREDEPSHLLIVDPALCRECQDVFESPCAFFCPTEVYRRQQQRIHISASNCIHCGTCVVKCPYQNIRWTPPEGAEGPRYKSM